MPATLHHIFDGDRPVTQRFGANPGYYAQFGLAGHEGVDYGCEPGVACRAAVSGQVVRAGWGGDGLGSAYGNAVEVWDRAQQVALVWCHLSEVAVSPGQMVAPGTLIGRTGSSGSTAGAHLHFMLALTDGAGNRLNLDNGYWGNVDCLDRRLVRWVTDRRALTEPAAAEAADQPPLPEPAVAPPARAAHRLLAGVGVWERDDAADYGALAQAKVRWVAIQATSGAGGGPAARLEAAFPGRAQEARGAGLTVIGWTAWRALPGAAAGEAAGSLLRSAAYTADLGFDVAGWAVDVQDARLGGLGEALAALRDATGRPVYLTMPGAPLTAGLRWDWPSVTAPVEALIPQIHTSPRAWNGSPNPRGSTRALAGVREALAELTNVAGAAPLLPRCDETDPVRIREWCAGVTAVDPASISFWRWGSGDLSTIAQYTAAFTAPPGPAPEPANTGGNSVIGDNIVPTPAVWWRSLTTPSDGMEQGVYTSEFLVTQLASVLLTALGLAAAFGWIPLSEDERRQIVQLVVGVIGLLQAAYTLSRGVRKAGGGGSRPAGP